jgi:glucose/arabinose dehydrogenase
MRRRANLSCACLVALGVIPTVQALDYRIERIASGLNQPTYVTQAPGDPPNIIYFTERTSNTIAGFNAVNQMGKIYRYDMNTRTKTLVLDLSSRSVTQDDGLTAIAFSPDFQTNGKFYVSSAAAGGASPVNRIEEYSIGAGGAASFDRTILQYNNTGTAFQNHTIDWLGFDPTATGAARNYLYISSGDGNFSLPNRPSQDPSDPEGKILRVDVSGGDSYPADPNKNFLIPSTNPLPAYNAAHPAATISGLGEVYVTGLRNPSRVSFDRSTGDMFIGDVGESTTEELDFLKAGSNASGPPVDYGWPQHEGTADTTGTISNVSPRTPTNPFTGVTSLLPIQQYPHNGGGHAIIGGYVYRGPISSLDGQYFFSDYVTGTISQLHFDPNTPSNFFNGANGTLTDVSSIWHSTTTPIVFDPTDPNYTPANVGANWGVSHIVSFGEDNAGNLYIVDFGGFAGDTNFNGQYPGAGQGEIFMLVPVPEPGSAGILLLFAGMFAYRMRTRTERKYPVFTGGRISFSTFGNSLRSSVRLVTYGCQIEHSREMPSVHPHLSERRKMRSASASLRAPFLLAAAVGLSCCAMSARGGLTHRYSFNDGTANDSVGSANGTLVNSATVSGGQLQLNNPNFSTAAQGPHGYLSLPGSILPSSGSATIEQWFTFGGSGFFTEAYAFTDSNSDANPPGANNGEYLLHAISAPQPASPPGGANTGGDHVAQALSGYAGSLTPPPGPETDAYETTPGIGVNGGGYLDGGGTYMAATVIDGNAGTLSYYLFDIGQGGLGGLQQSITAIPLSAYSFTNCYLGRSPFLADNATSGSIDEFRIYNNAQSAAQVAADFAAGPDVIPEPASLGLLGIGALGLLARRSARKIA